MGLLLTFALQSSAFGQTADMLVWMDSRLPEGTYVAGHVESRALGSATWTPTTQIYQPFKTKVNFVKKQVYFRKDANEGYYGEIFNYDDQLIYLRQETFPYFYGVDPPLAPWDVRPDKFRLFAGISQGNKPYMQGRVVAPRTIPSGWNYQQYFNTYYCHNWSEFQSGACPIYQSNAYDNSVTVEALGPFSTVFDGEIAEWPAAADFKAFGSGVVINQIMNNNAARERFFFAQNNGVYYGFVRWDLSVLVDGQWVVTDRTVGLKTASDASVDMTFEGMKSRGQRDSQDIGLRINGNAGVAAIATEPSGTLSSPLRVNTADSAYGVVLVAPSDASASGLRIQTASGLKALAKLPGSW